MGITEASDLVIYRPSADGCNFCNGQGYRGRKGIFELVVINEALRSLIHDQASEAELNREARYQCRSIFDAGKGQVLAGNTSLEEVLRVTHEV